MNELALLKVTSDYIFKLIFGDQRNTDILTALLKSVLDTPDEEFEQLTIVDPYIKKESENDKYGILDVKVHTKHRMVAQVEIQVLPLPDMIQRVVYGQAKMITEQMGSGDRWSKINRVVNVIIVNFPLIEGSDRYHHQFRNRTEDGIEFTDLTEYNILELSKLPKENDGSDLWYWLKFMKSENEEALKVVAERNPVMKKAVGILMELSEDERTRMIAESREKEWRDWMSRMDGAKLDGIKLVARNAISEGLDIETIIRITGLTSKDIESLQSK
jgi:predicted transposase/invertase (TIGR01784 family)